MTTPGHEGERAHHLLQMRGGDGRGGQIERGDARLALEDVGRVGLDEARTERDAQIEPGEQLLAGADLADGETVRSGPAGPP
jgi:hypothetical protein